MDQRTPIILPIINSVTTVCFVLAFYFSLRVFLNDPSRFNWQMIVYGICSVLSLVTAIVNWIRYKKTKERKNSEE